MRIGILSQNMGEIHSSPNIQDDSIISLNPDIYVEMTQEDGRTPDGMSVINGAILEEYHLIKSASLNGKQTTKQNIQLNIFVKNNLPAIETQEGKEIIAPKESTVRLGLQTIAKSLHTGYGYSKGMVYVKLMIPGRPLLFVNMHLPVKTGTVNGVLKNDTLGLEFRKATFFKLLQSLQDKGVLDDQPQIFVSGDLNFRMDKSGRNQLNDIINESSDRILNLRELPYAPGEKRITCKFTKNNSECRMRTMPTERVANFLEKIQKNCGNSLRTPSRCDRFLISTKRPININLNTTKYLLEGSDHNAILCCFDIDKPLLKRNTRRLGIRRNGTAI